MEREKFIKRICIIGAGFSGLAVAWYSLEKGMDVTVIDAQGIGGGASGIAAGLLHPYVGAHSKKTFCGDEGMQATRELLKVAENALGRPVARWCGMFRPASDETQQQDFSKAAQTYPDISWIEKGLESEGVIPIPGIMIHDAAIVDTQAYLQGLWKACEEGGAVLEKRKIEHLDEVRGYDQVVVATGAGSASIKGMESVRMHLVKGQVLRCVWPEKYRPLPCAVNCYAYLLPGIHEGTCVAGATYEHTFADMEPDKNFAIDEILPKVRMYFPELSPEHVIDVRSGARVSSPDRRPIVKQIGPYHWLLTGMGSRGLLYHALYAREVSL